MHESISPPCAPQLPEKVPTVHTWHSPVFPLERTKATLFGLTDANSVPSALVGSFANLMTTVVVATTTKVKSVDEKKPKGASIVRPIAKTVTPKCAKTQTLHLYAINSAAHIPRIV